MKRLLVLNFFPAFYPPSSGGEQRYYYLYHHLSRHYDITLLSPTYADRNEELLEFNEHFREWRVPKNSYHQALHVQLDADGIGPECSALVCALASEEDDAYRSRYRALVGGADAVIHECPFMLNYDEEFDADGRPRIYNSYNVEALLAEQMLQGTDRVECVALIRALEQRLVRGSAAVGVSSQEDKTNFIELYGCDPGKMSFWPNGFEPPGDDASRPASLQTAEPFVLFLGSAHPPNVQAAKVLIEIARQMPAAQFVVAGSVCSGLESVPANVLKLGHVAPAEKIWLLSHCAVALNPVVTGGGSNLKMLDYMSAGAAIVTTRFGARGIDIEDGIHCLIRSEGEFADAIAELLDDELTRTRIGEAARARAYERYTWAAIAEHANGVIDGALNPSRIRRAGKPQLLLVNDFPVHTPRGGGEFRIYHLYTRLAAWYRITLLCLSDEEDIQIRQIAEDFVQISVPKASDQRKLERYLNSVSTISTADIVAALCCSENKELIAQFQRLSKLADIIVLVHPYMTPLLGALQHPRPIIYESLNVEDQLKSQLLFEHPLRNELLDAVREMESYLSRNATRIVSVSAEERDEFSRRGFGEKVRVVRNGVVMGQSARTPMPSVQSRDAIAVFIGSPHPPNIEAVTFIVERLAPALPEIRFVVIGGVCDVFAGRKLAANVVLRGFLTQEEKEEALRNARLGINPMFSGGGSNLKVAEFFAAGVPVLSTPFGIRGYEVTEGRQVAVADREGFAARLRQLIGDRETLAAIASEAKAYAAENLSWDTSTRHLQAVIDECLATPPNRLLVVTYRYTEPPRGGGEVYLQNMLLEMAHRSEFTIDLATVAIDTIRDWMHFSAQYGEEQQPLGALEGSFGGRVLKFPLDPASMSGAIEGAKQLFDLWQEESLAQARQFVDRYQASTLMGGWYPVETHGAGYRRWCGCRAEIFCAPGTQSLLIAGYTPDETPLRIRSEKGDLYAGNVSGNFSLRVRVQNSTGMVLRLESDARYRAAEDPRRLGICVSSIREVGGDFDRDLSLADDFESAVRAVDPAQWVACLVELTQRRAAEIDEIFYRIRGPHSADLVRFLQQHSGDYDVVLVHGTPFSTAVFATQAAKQSDTPVVMLPHFHPDDRYYHWRCFYEAFRAADLVLAAPEVAKTWVFDPLGVRAISIPGGAVHIDEFSDLESQRRSFREAYHRDRPFVLVLGRKTGAKHYRKAIEAVRVLNAAGIVIDLVLIGPDEDNVLVTEPFATYLGPQPREIVLGALASCLCLATMSESESFGIVLVEAWMCRRPVLANSNCLAFSSLIDEGKDGLLCRDIEELAAGIRLFVERPELAASYGDAGYQKATAKYTWSGVVDQIVPELMALTAHRESVSANAT
jgi:glycosyltransferase involved in cell wall biosynthesis